MNACSLPPISELRSQWAAGAGGGPVHHQICKAKYLAHSGWETVEDPLAADIVHVHGVSERRLIDVLTIHAVWPCREVPEHPPWWDEQNAVMAAAMRRARRVVALSEFTAGRCRELAGDLPHLVVIPQAIDPEEWQDVSPGYWRARLGLGDRPLVLWGKNTVDGLRDPAPALSLAHLRPGVEVVLTAAPEALAAWGKLPPNVHAVGRQTFLDMQHWLADCDVYLATTLEASGQQHLEAMYMVKPILGYTWGGVAETVTSGKQGILVPPGDTAALAEGLDKVLKQGKFGGKFGRAARLQAGKFLWPEAAEKLAGLYAELLEDE
jgi:glycosyltransferase involved in cell wall biosynthesis